MKNKTWFIYSAVALLVASISITGTWAYASLTATTINACVSRIGIVRILTSDSVKCLKNESLVSWNIKGEKGEQGATGPQGPQGVPGPAGASNWDEERVADIEKRLSDIEALNAPDTTKPVIQNVQVYDLTAQGGTLVWSTSELASMQTILKPGPFGEGCDASCLDLTNSIVSNGNSHSLIVTGLLPNHEYYFRQIATDTAGNTSMVYSSLRTLPL